MRALGDLGASRLEIPIEVVHHDERDDGMFHARARLRRDGAGVALSVSPFARRVMHSVSPTE